MTFSPLTIAAALFAGMVSAVRAAETSPVIWKLDDPKSVAGLPTEILGQPKIGQDAEGKFAEFNGKTDGFIVTANPLADLKEFTIQVLFRPDEDGLTEQRFVHLQDDNRSVMTFETRLNHKGQWAMDTFLASPSSRKPLLDMTLLHPTGQWYWAAIRYKDGTMTSFLDGKQELSGPVHFKMTGPGKIGLGVRMNRVYWFKGSIREIRFYPKALSADSLERAR